MSTQGVAAGQPDSGPPDAPEPDRFDSPAWSAIKRGAKWGSLAGLIVSQLIIGANSIETPYGSIYGGNMLGLFAVCIGLGTAVGAGIGWLSTLKVDDEDVPPPEPFG